MNRLLLAVTFLTRLPFPARRNITKEELGRSVPFFPVVGLLLGLILAGTGGLHVDGLMDTCDGVFSGRDRETTLEIMRDSRIGAFGALGAICMAALKITAMSALGSESRWAALLLFPMLGRWSMVWVITFFPYARKTPGLGKWFSASAKRQDVIWATLPVIAVIIPIFLLRSIPILVTVGAATFLLGKWFSHKLGGLTGDTYGAICEITETLSLLVMCANG